jgi:hypothetical protein
MAAIVRERLAMFSLLKFLVHKPEDTTNLYMKSETLIIRQDFVTDINHLMPYSFQLTDSDYPVIFSSVVNHKPA